MTNIIILVILVFLSAFFSGVETAFVSLSRYRLEYLVDKKVQNAKLVKKLKGNYSKLIITLLIGNNIVNISASALATIVAVDLFGSLGMGVAIGIMTFIILVIGEIFPKNIAMTYNELICLKTVKIINLLQIILYPFVWFFEKMTYLVCKVCKIKVNKKEIVTEEEIKSIINLGHLHGEIEEDEKQMIHNLFRFSDMKAHEAMTPLKNVVYVDEHDLIKKVLPIIVKSGFSRIPIFSNKEVVGVLYVKEILKLVQKKKLNIRVCEIMHPPLFIKKNMLLDDIFRLFEKERPLIAIVKDRKKVLGIITMEDLLEQIVGPIYDESDVN